MALPTRPDPAINIGPSDALLVTSFNNGASAAADGDVMVLIVCGRAANPQPAPTSTGNTALEPWTEFPFGTTTTALGVATKDMSMRAFWCRMVSAADPPTINLAASGGNWRNGFLVRIQGLPLTGNPFNAAAASKSDTEATTSPTAVPAITTTQPDCLIVQVNFNTTDTVTGQYTVYSTPDLANTVALLTRQSSTGDGGGFYSITGEKAVAGAIGVSTITMSTASVQIGATIAFGLAPVVAATNGGESLASWKRRGRR